MEEGTGNGGKLNYQLPYFKLCCYSRTLGFVTISLLRLTEKEMKKKRRKCDNKGRIGGGLGCCEKKYLG